MSNFLILGATSAVASKIAQNYIEQSYVDDAPGKHAFYLVGRREGALNQMSQELGEAVVGIGIVDFLEIEATTKVIESAYRTLGSFDYVLIAHGILGDQLLSESSVQEAINVITTNYTSVVAQLVVISQLMSQQSAGKIGVITSVAGERGRPRNFTYGSAKGALSVYLQGLRSVNWGSGLEIYTFKLGPVDSPMTVDHEKNASFSTVDEVASHIIRAFETRRYVHYIPGYWAWVMWFVRWVPESIFQRLGFLSDR